MSHANGQARFEDGTVLHFEYNGTGDWCFPRLWATNDEVHEHWRTEINAEHECTCGEADEPCLLACDYGGGSWWNGRACRRCNCITYDAIAPWNDEDEARVRLELPSWWVNP